MTALVLPFGRTAPPPPPMAIPANLNVGCQSADEAMLACQLLLACAPPRRDALDAAPAVKKSLHQPWTPIVIVDDRGLHIIASADVVRRIAVTIDQAGRKGAALDLLRACDDAEALAGHMQRGGH